MGSDYLLTFAEQLLFGVGVGCVIVFLLALWLGKRASLIALTSGIVLLFAYFGEAALPIDSGVREFLVPVLFNTLMFGSAWLVAGVLTMKLGLWIRGRRPRNTQ